MNMADERSFALFMQDTKAGNSRTWPVTDADNRQGGAASFKTKVMVKLKQSVLTLETGSQREQMLSMYVTSWAHKSVIATVILFYETRKLNKQGMNLTLKCTEVLTHKCT